MKIRKKRPTLNDAYCFHKTGTYSATGEGYITSEERIKLVQEFSDSVEKLLKKELPQTKNLILLILKCHVIIEYALNKFIEFQSIPVINLAKENFTFAQKITLAYMLGFHSDPILIPSIELINKIRNKVAHTLQVDTAVVDELLKINSEDIKKFKISKDIERIKGLRRVTSYICGHICGITGGKIDAELR